MIGYGLGARALLQDDRIADAGSAPIGLDLNRPVAGLAVLVEARLVLLSSQSEIGPPLRTALGTENRVVVDLPIPVETVDPPQLVAGSGRLIEQTLTVPRWNSVPGNLRATLSDIARTVPGIVASAAGEDTSRDPADFGGPVALAVRVVPEETARCTDGAALPGHTDFEMQVVTRSAADLSSITQIGTGFHKLPDFELRLLGGRVLRHVRVLAPLPILVLDPDVVIGTRVSRFAVDLLALVIDDIAHGPISSDDNLVGLAATGSMHVDSALGLVLVVIVCDFDLGAIGAGNPIDALGLVYSSHLRTKSESSCDQKGGHLS